MAYTGTAYIGDLPTDEWIAEALLKKELPRIDFPEEKRLAANATFPVPHDSMPSWMDPRTPVTTFGRQRTFLNLSAAIFHLATEIDGLFRDRVTGDAAKQGLEVVVAGWEWRPERPARPILFRLVKGLGSRCYRRRSMPRMIGDHWYFNLVPSGQANVDEQTEFRRRMENITNPRVLISTLRDVIKTVAARKPGIVGTELMAIRLPPPASGRVLIEFGGEQQKVDIYGFPTEVSYTPWVITPVGFAPPAMVIGSQLMRFGRWRIEITAPRSTGAVIGAMYPQRRHRRP